MNKKIKTILSYIGVALLGALTGVGALVGVSSCSQSEKTTTPLKSVATKKQARITPSLSNPFEHDKSYYIVAKNYEQNGNGVFYNESISLENSAIINTNGNNPILAEFDIIDNNTYIWVRFQINAHLNGGVYKLSSVQFANNNYSYSESLYIATGQYAGFNRNMCAFTMTNFRGFSDGTDTTKTEFYNALNKLFYVYDLDTPYYAYDFTESFNYNNLYQEPGHFINRGNTPVVNAVGTTTQTMTYDLPWFYSNGLVFNQMKAYFYVTAYNYFQESDGSWNKYESNVVNNYYLYFHHLDYVNKATNYSLTVCNRISAPYHEAGWTAIYKEVVWTSSNYQKIEFQNEITYLSTKNILDSLSSNILGGFTEITNNDIGLGNAFSLIGLAFSSVSGLLSIAVLPGITLGLLLFLPLIAGIIVAIIWVVKR